MLTGAIQFIERLFESSWRTALLTLALAAFIFIPLLDWRPLLGSDETRVAAISAEMSRYGDWVEPTLNGKPFLEIPPMHWWISAAVFKLFGESDNTAKLPSALAAVAGIMCAFGLARVLGLSNFIAFLCAMILATAPEYWIIGRRCIMDMTLCAFVALAFLGFAAFARTEQPASRRWLWLGVFCAGLSGALLTKGIIGLGIPCAGLFIWLLVKRERSMIAWGGLFGAAALSLLPISAWLLELYCADGIQAVKTLAWTNNIGRFMGDHNEHVEPFTYYFTKFPAQFLPWTAALAGAAVLLFSGKLKGSAKNAAVFGGICFLVPFAVLCVAAGKRAIYLLPLYPVAALLAACAFDWAFGFLKEAWKPMCKAFAILVFALAAVALLASDAFLHHKLSKRSSYEPAFAKCASLLASGRHMVIHSPQERIIGASVFYLGRRFAHSESPELTRSILSEDDKSFAVADDASFEAMGPGVRLIDKFPLGRGSYIAVFDIEPPKAR